MPSGTREPTKLQDAYCPHCHLLIEHKVDPEWPQSPLRCPHCRLLVGVGRARPTPAAEPGASQASNRDVQWKTPAMTKPFIVPTAGLRKR